MMQAPSDLRAIAQTRRSNPWAMHILLIFLYDSV